MQVCICGLLLAIDYLQDALLLVVFPVSPGEVFRPKKAKPEASASPRFPRLFSSSLPRAANQLSAAMET